MLNVIAATLVVILASVIAVRAYLSAATEKRLNAFASMEMTYTDTDTVELNGSTYSIVIESGETTGTLKHNNSDKSAYVHNSEGADKKPVFVRVTMVMDIYDANGVNVTREYPTCTPGYNHSDPEGTLDANQWENNWVERTSNGLTCYYYKHVLIPGGNTRNVFDSVTIDNADKLPQNATVKIRVITDTVQAVATDDMDWTAADYTDAEMKKVWTDVQSVTISNSGLTTQASAPVAWTFK